MISIVVNLPNDFQVELFPRQDITIHQAVDSAKMCCPSWTSITMTVTRTDQPRRAPES